MAVKHTDHHDQAAPANACSHSEDMLAAASKAHRCPIEQAGAWCDYDLALMRWRHRCADLLMDMLASPARYLQDRKNAYMVRHRRPMSSALAEDMASVLEENRMALLHANPGKAWVQIANEIAGNTYDMDTLTRLSLLGWLPRKPTSPNAAPRRRPENDDERMARADRIAADLVGEAEQPAYQPARAVDISDGPEFEADRADLR